MKRRFDWFSLIALLTALAFWGGMLLMTFGEVMKK